MQISIFSWWSIDGHLVTRTFSTVIVCSDADSVEDLRMNADAVMYLGTTNDLVTVVYAVLGYWVLHWQYPNVNSE